MEGGVLRLEHAHHDARLGYRLDLRQLPDKLTPHILALHIEFRDISLSAIT